MSDGGAAIYYRIDSSGAYSTYSGSLSISTPGSHKVDYYSVDAAGNAEAPKSGYVNIDETAPTTTQGGADDAWHASDVPLTFTADDHGLSGVARTEYRIDPADEGAAWTTGSTVTVATSLGDGAHTVQYRSVDNAGNVEPYESCNVKIDTTLPTTTASGLATDRTSTWQRTPGGFTLTASDAASGVATTEYAIDGSDAQLYTGGPVPVSGDASHVITYWSTDAAGNVEATQTAYMNIDTTAPTTSADGLAAAPSTGWTRTTPQSVSLAATDATSGMSGGDSATYFRVDSSGAYSTYDGPLSISTPGSHKVDYYSVDAAGNAETPQSGYVNIDMTAPITSADGLQSDDHSGWRNSAQTVALTPSDTQSGVAATYYTIDSGGQQTYTGAFSLSAPGSHAVTFWSVDALGNAETPQSGYVNVDMTAPITSADGLQSDDHSGWRNRAQTVALTPSDTQSGVAATYYTIDSGGQQTYTGAFSLSAPGSHAVTLWSVDALGNSETPQGGYVNIDTTAPGVTDDADGAWHRQDVVVTLDPADLGGSGIAKTQYRLQDSQDWLDSTADRFTVSADSNDGSHTYQYRALDAAGNASDPATCTVKIDTAAPTTTQSGADDAWHASDVPLTFTADDHGLSGVDRTEYRVDPADESAAWTTGSAVTVTASLGDGVHAVQYRSVDNAGNVETYKSCTVKIDTAAPTTTQSGADDAWHATDVPIAFSADDQGLSGVAHTEYRVDPAGDADPWTAGVELTVRASIGDGVHTVQYRSVDNAGNVETCKSCTVKIDTQQPVTIDNAGTSWHAVPFTLQLSASGLSGTTTQYSIGDDTHWQNGSTVAFTPSGSAEAAAGRSSSTTDRPTGRASSKPRSRAKC